MASKDLSITDVFPMRKRRALGLGTTKRNQHDSENARGENPMPEPCLLGTPNTKAASAKRKPRNSPLGENDKQLPVKTPTRSNVSPAAVLGRLRRTPQRLAAWRSLSGCDSGPEIIWDNDCHSPTNALDCGSINGCSSKGPMQGQLASIIKKISKDCKSLRTVEANLFDSWMKKDDGENAQSFNPADRHSKKKKSVIHKPNCGDNPKPKMPRRTRKWSRTTSNNAVKIKEELSNFIKDISEREKVNAASSEEEGMGKETEKSDQPGTLNENLVLDKQHAALDLIDDNEWLDFEDLPAELKEFGTSEYGGLGQVEYAKGNPRRKVTGDFEEKVAANLLTCAGSVFSSDKRKTDRKDSDPGNETDCYIKKNLQRDVHKESDWIQQEIALHRHEDRKGEKLFEDISKAASLTSLKRQKDNMEGANAICEQGKRHLVTTKLKQTYDVGAKAVAATGWEKWSVDLPLEIGKSVKHNSVDVGDTEQPFTGRKLVPFVKGELLTARGEEENEFNELINSEDEYIFDELEEDINAEKFTSIDGMVEECNLSDLEREDFGEDIFIAEENENQSETAENRERAKASCEFMVDREKEKMLKGNVLNFDEWFEIDNDLNEIDFDDNGGLLNGDSYVNDCESLQKSKAGLENPKKFLTSVSQIKTKCLGKNRSVENKCSTKGCFVECENEKINFTSSKGNCNMQHGGNGRAHRSEIVSTFAAVSNIKHEAVGAILNTQTEEGGLVATKRCKGFEGNAKPQGVVGHVNEQGLATVGKAAEVTKLRKVYESSVDSCLKKQFSSPSGLEKDDNIEFHASNCILNNDSLIEIDLEMTDWDDEICFQGDQFAIEQKCSGRSINDGRSVVTQLTGQTKIIPKKLLRETELSDDAQGLDKHVTSDVSKCRDEQYVTSDVSDCQEPKCRRNKFNFKPIRSLHKENSIPPAADIIAAHTSEQTRDMQRAKVEVECKHNSKIFFEPELSLIANEATGICDKIDDGSCWDEGLSPFNKFSAPITSTQKTEQFLYREQSKTRRSKICTAEEIKKKRAEAMKKLEHRKLNEKQRK